MQPPLEVLPNPALKPEDLDGLDAKFMEAAALHDRGQDIPSDLLKTGSDAPAEPPDPGSTAASEPASQPDIKAKEAKVDERARDPVSGKFVKTEKEIADEKAASGTVDASKTVPESEYAAKVREKAEKEEARKAKSWESLNQQKEELAAREREFQERAQQQQRAPQRQRPLTDDGQAITSKMLGNAARDFKARAKQALDAGDYDTFNEQTGLADKTLEHARQFYQIEQKEAREKAFEHHKAVWESHIQEVFKQDEAARDPESPLSKEINRIFEATGNDFFGIPHGFRYVHDYATQSLKAKAYEAANARAIKAEAEVARLNGLLTPTVGGVTVPSAAKTLDSMSDEEADAYFQREAHKADQR